MTPTVQAIAWTLIHFCWQAAALAALYRAVSLLTARCSSNTRYLLALSTLLLMLAVSVGTFAFEVRSNAPSSPFFSSEVNAAPTHNFSPVKTAGSGAPPSIASAFQAATAHTVSDFIPLPTLPLPMLRFIVGLWMVGVLVLSLRSIGGWWFIQRLRAASQGEAPVAVRASFRRIAGALGIHRQVLLRVSKSVASPVTVGALRAIVLLPLSAVTSLGPDELEVVLAHELAHIRRADYFWNLMQILVETLFFFHPAIWWLGARIRHERELCCDDLALTVCPNPIVYANALFQLEKQRSRPGRLAMALDGHQSGQTLKVRIARILGDPVAEAAHRGPFSLAAAAALLVVLLLPVPQVMAGRQQAQAAAIAPMAAAITAPSTAAYSQEKPSPAVAAPEAPVPDATVQAAQTPASNPVATEPVAAEASDSQDNPAHTEGHSTYIDRMKAAGYDVDLDKMIAMKVQDITPEYAQKMNQMGFGKLSADKLIAMKVQDITPEYAQKMDQLGFGKLSVDDLISCKVQGVSPEVIAKFKQDGLEVKDVHEAISYKIFEVTPEFVAGMKAAGFKDLDSKQLVALRVQGVTPDYAKSIAQQYPGATVDDVVKTRIFNIDAAFIASAKSHGFTDLNLEKLVKLRVSGILDDDSGK